MNNELTGMPRIGDKAPDFNAVTTTGKLNFSDYNQGSWVVFFSHPADFTPVCTTEMSGFAKEQDSFFATRNAKLLGLSIDSIHSHIAWVENVRKNTGVLFKFPIVADIDMSVSKLWGMLQPGESETAAVRAVFIVDPMGVIRLIMYYPMNVGRSMDEIKRCLIALQTSAENSCSMPLNWQPGDNVILPAPKTLEALDERVNSGLEMMDFYLATKSL
ncbi:peroxiredoxin [Spirosoma utsteinense]|uniref:peroxiredoxin n=1 Tax=Spirosoma utsteinense TaxID=2585773 RepID=UPI001646DEBA|nr:peroxiredoxin [Spirosoma utsteinense]MBC3787027.1 peroxiredoxin (alkyl hydroperoxide reductase subunit C) [Spirosoma utsteinense]